VESIGILTLIVLVLAAYRLTRLIVADVFPFEPLRDRTVGTKFGYLLTCPFCSSVWVGFGLAVGQAIIGGTVGWQVFIGALALSAIVSLATTIYPHLFD
jgi:hypothetical protein